MQEDSNATAGSSDRRLSLAEEARELVAANRRGGHATLIQEEGAPYGSLVDLAPLPGSDVIMFLSTLAEHQQFLVKDPRASIFITPGFMEADTLAHTRVTLVGRVTLAEDRDSRVDLHLKYHSNASCYITFPDFQFYRLRVEKARFIAGFGRIGWIRGDRYRAVSVISAL